MMEDFGAEFFNDLLLTHIIDVVYNNLIFLYRIE